jgi:hypothetical protein
MKSFAFAKNLNLKSLFLIALFSLATSLQGCAAGLGGAYEHGIGYCNVGSQKIAYLKIEYGDVLRPIELSFQKLFIGGDKNCLSGGSHVAYMPIPVTMTVEWQTVDGPRRKAIVPIRSLVTNKHPARRFQVRFNDEHVQVYQTNVTLTTRDYTVIFEQ